MSVDFESVLTGPNGFGLESASFLQRFRCRVVDGAPTTDLWERGTEQERRFAESAIGCSPNQLHVGSPPVEVHDHSPVRTAKSLGMAALAFCRSQTIDVSSLKPGEAGPRISILATTIDNAKAIRGHLAIVNEKPALRAAKLGETDDTITLRHPSGVPVEIKVVAAHRGGISLASRWSGSVLFDEAPSWYSTDKVVSLEESREQALPRLLPGAQCYFGGSKWQPSGHCYDQEQEHFGNPSSELVVIAPTEVDGVSPAQQLNPVYWTDERIARVKRTSPRSYAMHVQNLYGASAIAAYELSDLEASARHRPGRGHVGTVIIAFDPSKLLPDSDAWAVVVCYWFFPKAERVPVLIDPVQHGFPPGTHLGQAYGELGEPLFFDIDGAPYLRIAHASTMPEGATWNDVKHTVTSLIDHYSPNLAVMDMGGDSSALVSLCQSRGVQPHIFSWTSTQKKAGHQFIGRLLRDRAIEITQPELRSDLAITQAVLKPDGQIVYRAPRTKGRHADLASALVSAGIAHTEGLVDDSPLTFRSGRHVVPGR